MMALATGISESMRVRTNSRLSCCGPATLVHIPVPVRTLQLDPTLVFVTAQAHPTPRQSITRQLYAGYPFVFATDAYHCTETVYGNQDGDSVLYLKPMNRGQRIPYFFTGFAWKDVDGHQCSVSLLCGMILGNLGSQTKMSRVKLCDAWQIAFNRLLHHASFLEEIPFKLSPADIQVINQEFIVVRFHYTIHGRRN